MNFSDLEVTRFTVSSEEPDECRLLDLKDYLDQEGGDDGRALGRYVDIVLRLRELSGLQETDSLKMADQIAQKLGADSVAQFAQEAAQRFGVQNFIDVKYKLESEASKEQQKASMESIINQQNQKDQLNGTVAAAKDLFSQLAQQTNAFDVTLKWFEKNSKDKAFVITASESFTG